MTRRTARDSSAWDHFERIQAFKADPGAVVGGINYARVIALYLYERSLRQWLKTIAFSFFFATRVDVTGTENQLLHFYSYRYKQRADLDYIADRLVALSGNQGDAAEAREVMSGMQLWRTLACFPSAWRAASGYQAGLRWRFSSAALIAKYRSTAKRLFNGIAVKRTRVVTFCDAAPHDNLLAQLARFGGAETLTVQHGQYRLLDATNISADAEAYTNFVSDRLLCWGEATRAEFTRYGIDPGRLVITGWIRPWEVIPLGPAKGVFGVMLNGENGAESNDALLQAAKRISEELDLRFLVRLHPRYSEARYSSLVSQRCVSIGPVPTRAYVEAVDFSISHMSGATIEMLQLNSPVYVLDDGRLAAAFRCPGLSFVGVDEILTAVRDDSLVADRGCRRTQRLKRWFNDDTDQDLRILSIMLDQEI